MIIDKPKLNQPTQKVTFTEVWAAQPGPQTWLIQCPVFETLFGGARGGGKSDGVLGEWVSHADMYGANAIGLCVRRERTQLTELIERSKVIYAPLGATFHETDKMWRFPNGARLRFAYLENDTDAESYQGHSYTRVYVEELGTFANPAPIFKLMATLRSGAGVPCRFIATANPGGPGHLWIKQRYIDPAPLGMKIIPTEFINPFTKEKITKDRIFIPSKVTDNKYTNTPEYIGNLYLSGNEELVKAWLTGDWNVMLGAYFTEWETQKHVIKAFNPPNHWTRFMSMDWGTSKPFSIGWWCIVPDRIDANLEIYPEQWRLFNKNPVMLPKGAIIRYREYYGCQRHIDGTGQNIGLKMTPEEVAKKIMELEKDEPKDRNGRPRIAYRVCDPAIIKSSVGPSEAERMGNKPYHLYFQKADNTRANRNGAMGGWSMVRQYLKGTDSVPNMFFMDNCIDAIRTLPAMQHSPTNIEDVDTSGEDHAPDEIRYACMSRPFTIDYEKNTVAEVIKQKENCIFIKDDIDDINFDMYGNESFNSQRIN
jgi:hypothetical protein